MHAWLEWARGPAFVFCFSFMLLGLARHVGVTAWELRRTLRRAGDPSLPLKAIGIATARWLVPVNTIRREPLFTVTSILFHVAVIGVPVLLAGHVALWAPLVGLTWPTLPNPFADVLTILAVVTAAGLIVQRLAARATRALSRPEDYVLLVLLAFPFVSGFLVMHPAMNPFGYEPTLFVHVMSGNLIFLLMPLTKLTHAALLPSAHLVAEVGWHWPRGAGSRVGAALGKEGEPV
jgi:nitrate reductase gamma subunit